MASKAVWRKRQRLLNHWFSERELLKDIKPLKVDGVPGPGTRKRIREAKWFIGYTKNRGSAWTRLFENQLKHPHWKKYTGVKSQKRGRKRRLHHHHWWKHHQNVSHPDGKLDHFEGVTCGDGWAQKCEFARRHGWTGHINSGYRDPAYSESLCYRICGAPSCSGTCAGRSSNHSRPSVASGAAIDVSDYVRFGQIMARSDCPGPRVFNALPRDPVHFSITGR